MSLYWSQKKVFVTGAGGFIGSHLTHELVHRGAKVKAMVRYHSRGHHGWLEDLEPQIYESLEVVQGDLRDADTLSRYIKGSDVVFHLGAMISIPFSYLSPSEAHAVNTQGTLNVLNACLQHQIPRLMHTSTSEVYGTAQYVPIDEKHCLQGQSPYSASKIGADKLCESYFNAFQLPVTIVRPFNTYGPRQSARAIIPTIIVQALSQQKIKLGALSPTRDFTYVTDTALGMIGAMESKETAGQTMNLGVGSEISIGDLAQLILKLMGKESLIENEAARLRPEKSEVNRLLSDPSLAKKTFGFSPKISLEEGLKKTIHWLEKNHTLYERAKKQYVV